jgi:hypothetical protein
MKRIDKEELQKQSAEIAKQHKADVVYATEDGNYFLPSDVSLAKDHQAKNVKREFEDSQLHKFDFGKKEDANPEPEKPEGGDNTPPATENEQIEQARAKAKELSDSGVTNKNSLKAQLKKAGFAPEVINQALTPVGTHEE